MDMLRNIWILLLISWVSLGCYSGDLSLKLRFDQINGLKPGERIIFEENEIGRVTDVFYEKDGTYLVDVEIRGDFKNAVTGNSRFFVTNDPSDPGRKVVEMITVKGTQRRPLEDGAVVRGSTRLSALLEKMEEDASRTMADLKKRAKEYSDRLKEIPENEDLKRLQKDLDQLLEEIKRSGTAFREKVQKDLVPKLQKEIDKLKERLRELGREKEVEPIQTKMDEIRRI